MMKEVFIGVSGGVDSTVAVMLLKKEGYNVTGVHIDMFGQTDKDVSLLEERLGIKVISVNIHDRFRKAIVEPFVKAYISGETPSPCAECNPLIKWRVLEEVADKNGGENAKIATGHYCRVIYSDGYYYVAKAKDDYKNQSYYLWRLSQKTLSRALFPLGEYIKSDIKSFAAQCGLKEFAQKRESMGVCFLKGRKISDFLLSECAALESFKGGDIIDKEGNVIGVHNGYPFYTLAQRKGLPIKKGECVIEIIPDKNRIVIGTPYDLYRSSFTVGDCMIVNENEFFGSSRLTVNVRGVGVNPKGYCTVLKKENDIFVRLSSDRAWAVAAGQPVVFYIDDRVVGGAVVKTEHIL